MQALTVYRAILAAAESAPVDALADYVPAVHGRVTICTADTSTMTVQHCGERLRALAETVRKQWAAFGGGPRAPEHAPRPRQRAQWSASMLRVWRAQCECREWADVQRVGVAELGGLFYTRPGRGGGALLIVAPVQVAGLPDGVLSGCRDDGRWVVFDRVTGAAIDPAGDYSRAGAERAALHTWRMMGTDEAGRRLDAKRRDEPADQAAARDAWSLSHGLMVEPAPAAEPAPVAAVVVAETPAPAGPAVVVGDFLTKNEGATGKSSSAVVDDATVAAVHAASMAAMRAELTAELGRARRGRQRGDSARSQALASQLQRITPSTSAHKRETGRIAIDFPAAADGIARKLAAACLDRFGVSDVQAARHLPAFWDWHKATMTEILGTGADPAPVQASPAVDRDPAPVIGPARYARGQHAARCPSVDGFKSRAARLAEGLRARWSNREHAYILSPAKAARLLELWAAGADACSYTRQISQPAAAAQATAAPIREQPPATLSCSLVGTGSAPPARAIAPPPAPPAPPAAPADLRTTCRPGPRLRSEPPSASPRGAPRPPGGFARPPWAAGMAPPTTARPGRPAPPGQHLRASVCTCTGPPGLPLAPYASPLPARLPAGAGLRR